MRNACIAASVLLSLSACGNFQLPGTADSKAAGGSEPRVVVAVADTAFNPYHSYFYGGSIIYPDYAPDSVTPAVLEEFGIPPENQIELTRTGDFAQDIASDDEFWSRVEPGQFYWFKGTNLIGISFCTSPTPLMPMAEKNPHGAATSAAVLKANPEAVVLMVEQDCAGDVPGTADTPPEAEVLTLLHLAVDLVSSSYSSIVPLGLPRGPDYAGVVEKGKLYFRCAGNAPAASPAYSDRGAWWTIGVTGISKDSGQTLQAGDFPDFVSLYEDRALPHCMNCEDELYQFSGTSNSTPRAAGVASRVLLEARRALGHSGGIVVTDGKPAMVSAGGQVITNWDVRRALEEAAYADYGPEDYDLSAGLEGNVAAIGAPINPAAPWLQLGWGDLTPEPEKNVVAEALAHLGLGAPARFKSSGYCEYQTANMIFRQQYWGQFGAVPDPNPYRFCESALAQ